MVNKPKFLPPWIALDSKDSFENELTCEVSNGRLLFRKKVTAIAKREDIDDVLFELIGEDKYAIVHLTWKGATEHSPEYPRTQLFDNWAAIGERVIRDNETYNS